jgi:hypothetical protein
MSHMHAHNLEGSFGALSINDAMEEDSALTNRCSSSLETSHWGKACGFVSVPLSLYFLNKQRMN